MKNYKALVFDLGQVIFGVSFERAFGQWAVLAKLPVEKVRERFHFDETYDRYSENRITTEEYAQHVSALIGYPLSVEEFEKGWQDVYLPVYPGIDELLIALKKHHRIVSLTNTNPSHAKVWPVKFAPTLKHFEKIFASHEIGSRKPEKRAYETVIRYLQLPADEIIFLDDHASNALGAYDAGMKGITVTSTEQMIAELKKEGIKI